MASGGKGNLEKIRRGLRTAFFMLTMVASLLVSSAPVLVAVGDVTVSLALASRFACARCYGVKDHLERYGFKSSLMDIPLVSIIRSLIITCMYSFALLHSVGSIYFISRWLLCNLFFLADSSMVFREIRNSSLAENVCGIFDITSRSYFFGFVFHRDWYD